MPTSRFAYASGSRPLQGYTIKRGIGHGGFGEVYYATSDAGKEVALKLIRRNLDVELRGVTQCLNLKHPNLLSLYDVRQDDQGDSWVVMELMAGDSLEEVLNRHPEWSALARKPLAWIHGIAAGVAYLHDHGIVHRDLKPGNIFVDEGIVKIGDYGLSKFISCSRRSGQTDSVGTVHYMAPEMANGRYGKEIDIYALGIILYEMLTGHVPFEGESVGEILMKHLTAEPDVEPIGRAVSHDRGPRAGERSGEAIQFGRRTDRSVAAGSDDAAVRFAGPNPNAATAIYTPADPAGFDLSPPLDVAGHSPNAAPPPPPRGNGPGTGQANAAYGAGNAAGKSANANPAHEDPIVRWGRETWTDSKSWWERKNFKPWQKIAILILGLWVALNVFGALDLGLTHSRINIGHIAILGLIVWAIYNGRERRRAAEKAREFAAASPNQRPPYSNAAANAPNWKAAVGNPPVVAPPRPAYSESPTRRRWRSENYLVYQPGTPRERVTQLIGSMLLSAVACIVLSLVMMILRGESIEPNLYAWLATSSVLGSWAVLIPAKIWEGQRGDAVLRRFVMLVIGLVLGAASFGLANFLVVNLHPDWRFGSMAHTERFGADFYIDGTPQILAYLAVFGFMFVIVRWWRQADPLRSTRLSIWYTGVAVFFSWAIAAFWAFPQPWGLMLAATIAISVQLAAPWLTPAERAQLPRPAGGG